MQKNLWRGFCALYLVTLACRPVIAIGWEELLLLILLVAFLLGPPLYRFMRRLERFLKHEKKDKQ
ncbi:MAG TPA: hypothetical protein VFQ13_02650 [Anaerolineales bacterium]|nr:hypothetical protein [Anaerolineales bacterium]